MARKFILILILCVSISILILFFMANNSNKEYITILLDWTPNTNHTGIYIAQQLGYFEEQGLNVKIEQPPKESSTALLASGQVEFAVAFQDFFAQALIADTPLPVKAIAAIAQHNNAGIICRKSANISTVKHLAFKNYSTFDNPLEIAIIKHCMEHVGTSFNDINLVYDNTDNIVASLSSNIDATWGYFGIENVILDHFGIDNNFLFFRDIDSNLDYYTPILISNINYINNNSDTIRKVLKALAKGYTFAAENPEVAADILIKAVPELNYEIILESQKHMSRQYISDAPFWGFISEYRWNNFFDWLYDNNIINKPIKHGTSFTNEFLK